MTYPDQRYPKPADYPDDYPYEVVVVERDDAGNVKHVEVVSRHSIRSVAQHLLSTQRGSMTGNPRFTAELVTPTGMESA